MSSDTRPSEGSAQTQLEHGSDERFLDYYREESESQDTIDRSEAMFQGIMRLYGGDEEITEPLQVADIGCGPGTQSMVWALHGHKVYGLDVNSDFIDVARKRASDHNLPIEFCVGTASDLPWADGSMDICLVPELLEHVPEWSKCLDEFARLLKPGGLLYISTSNKLCPVQNEFDLPLYSWYPDRLKKHYEKLSVSTRPELVNYATYPAVNWFSYYQLRDEFAKRGLTSLDRLDFMDPDAHGSMKRRTIRTLRRFALLRFLVQLATPYSLAIGFKS